MTIQDQCCGRNIGLVDSRRVRTKAASSDGMRAFSYIRAIRYIFLLRTSMGHDISCVDAVAAICLCRKAAPSGRYHFLNEHRFVMRKTYFWDGSTKAVERDVRDCGFDFDSRDILDGIRKADGLKFGARNIARLVGYSMLVQVECDRLGAKIPFSPYDDTDTHRKMRCKALKRAREAARRISAGATPRNLSDAHTRPWEAYGIGRSKYYKLKQAGLLLAISPKEE